LSVQQVIDTLNENSLPEDRLLAPHTLFLGCVDAGEFVICNRYETRLPIYGRITQGDEGAILAICLKEPRDATDMALVMILAPPIWALLYRRNPVGFVLIFGVVASVFRLFTYFHFRFNATLTRRKLLRILDGTCSLKHSEC